MSLRSLPLALLVACGPSSLSVTGLDEEPADDKEPYVLPEEGDDPTDEPQYTEFDGARLVIHEPQTGIYHLGQGVPMQAEVVAADGTRLDFDDIIWRSDIEGVVYDQAQGGANLEVGIHTITAVAELPNGDRLAYAIGDVRVQHRYTGVYAGQMYIDVITDVGGQTLHTPCIGAVDFEISMDGEDIDGGGACSVSLVVLGAIDLNYGLVGSVDGNEADGDVLIDLGWFDIPVGWEGGFPAVDQMVGEFATPAVLFDIDADFDAHRVSPYVDP